MVTIIIELLPEGLGSNFINQVWVIYCHVLRANKAYDKHLTSSHICHLVYHFKASLESPFCIASSILLNLMRHDLSRSSDFYSDTFLFLEQYCVGTGDNQ